MINLREFKSAPVDRLVTVLPDGRHNVTIARRIIVTDRMRDLSGTPKDPKVLEANGVDYKDIMEQLAVTFVKKGEGVITHRYNTKGFVRYDELDDKAGYFRSAHREGYAISEENGERLEDPERTGMCKNILNELFDGCDLPTGSKAKAILQCDLSIEVYRETFNGKLVPKVRAPRKANFEQSGVSTLVTAKEEAKEEIKAKVIDSPDDDF